MSEGVDYSSTGNNDWAGLAASLLAESKTFAGRYAVNDKSPGGRGIGAAEYRTLRANGVDVFVYWESSAGWMLNGYQAGVNAALNAQANIIAAGMPTTMPIYFACDVDATPGQQAAIDDCLRGAASVIGLGRVGIYGGYYVVRRCYENGTAKWFCQTSAWSGGQWFEHNHLEQYAYNYYVYGTNCDKVRAKQANFGQASYFDGTIAPAVEAPVPTPAAPAAPDYTKPQVWAELDPKHPDFAKDKTVNGTLITSLTANTGDMITLTAIRDTPRFATANTKGPRSGPNIKKGTQVRVDKVLVSNIQKATSFGITNYNAETGAGGTRIKLADFLPKLQVSANGRVTKRETGKEPTGTTIVPPLKERT